MNTQQKTQTLNESLFIESTSCGADSIRHRGMFPLLQMAGHGEGGGTASRRTANKKLPKCTAHHESAHKND